MEDKNAAEASERRRMLEVDPALAFIAQQPTHAPRDPAAERAAAAEYKRALDHQNDKKKQHMWDAFVLDRLHDEKQREENLLAMGRQHLQRRRQRERVTASLRSSWAQAMDAKAAESGEGGGGGGGGGRVGEWTNGPMDPFLNGPMDQMNVVRGGRRRGGGDGW